MAVQPSVRASEPRARQRPTRRRLKATFIANMSGSTSMGLGAPVPPAVHSGTAWTTSRGIMSAAPVGRARWPSASSSGPSRPNRSLAGRGAASAETPQSVPVLVLVEEFFYLLPRPLGQPIGEPPCAHPHAGMRRLPPAAVDREVGLDPAPEQRVDEADGEESLFPPCVAGVKPRRRLARFSSAKQPAVSDATDRKISVSKPRRMRCRFSMRALTV
jgi:hypothetical protein